MLYKYMAIYICIQSVYNVPVECQRNHRPRSNVKASENLTAHLLITHEFYNRMSLRLQGLMRNLGTAVSGDEKLFYFTENSCYIMMVPSNPLESVRGCISRLQK